MDKKCNCDVSEDVHEHCHGCECVLRYDESENFCKSCEELEKDA